jgi:hypothetical protein
MELFLPSLFVFVLTMIVVLFIVPRLTPIIMVSMSAILLFFAIQQHKSLFASEYTLSTWQDRLTIFAPGVFIGAVILYLLYAITAFFNKGEVPVPAMPQVTIENMPSAETATNVVTQAINNTLKAANNAVNTIRNNASNINTNGLRKSFFEVI